MTVYFKCLCRSRDKILANKFKQQGAKICVTDWSTEHRREAKRYGLKLPFVVENGKARPIDG